MLTTAATTGWRGAGAAQGENIIIVSGGARLSLRAASGARGSHACAGTSGTDQAEVGVAALPTRLTCWKISLIRPDKSTSAV